jgi:uncharacterized protein
VIVLDVNLLLYASDATMTQHRESKSWIESIMNGRELIGLPWQTIHGFLRISTNPRMTAGGASMEAALAVVARWLDRKQVRTLSPGERHWDLLRRMLTEGNIRGPRTTDAQLAALTVEYGGILHTTDRDFARFPGLRWVNPLQNR